jgi:antitoxin component YwqK of YwqJK toxin-antitoxin module
MNLRRQIFIFILLLSFFNGVCQRFANQVPQAKRYTPQEITDPEYGIVIYNKMCTIIGGDSMRYSKDGYNVQGWMEDFYVSGKTLHKGFYVDGYIKIFKNYYENGQIERTFSSTDPRHSKIEIFYDDGKLKSKIEYFDGNPQNQYDFFKNGNPEYIEENDKDIEYLYKRNSFFETGNPESIFEMLDKKTKKYIKKEFTENGKLKEEGTMIFRKDLRDYQKDGVWNYYDTNGKILKTENYYKGELLL